MGPSQPPFCRPGRSVRGRGVGDLEELRHGVVGDDRGVDVARDVRGGVPCGELAERRGDGDRAGAAHGRDDAARAKGRDGATRGEETAGGTTRGRDVRARHRRSSRARATAGDLHGVFAFGVERAVALARGSDARASEPAARASAHRRARSTVAPRG